MLEQVHEGLHAGSIDSPLIRKPMGDSGPLIMLGQMMDNPAPAVYFKMAADSGGSPPHAHDGWAMTIVLEGSWTVGGIEQKAGDITLAEPNVFYGPFEPGPDGVVGIEIFSSLQAVPPIWGEHANDPRVLAIGEISPGEMVIYPPPPDA